FETNLIEECKDILPAKRAVLIMDKNQIVIVFFDILKTDFVSTDRWYESRDDAWELRETKKQHQGTH
ncbi:MAG TPA: hypothetical protein DDZ78_03040, partial [Porphyromonadaceae bacterium]|nr:hypothetical protein [Porphyromonadaceae bacterium]